MHGYSKALLATIRERKQLVIKPSPSVDCIPISPDLEGFLQFLRIEFMQDKINKIAKKYVGAPFKHAGRDISGIDCWGLFIRVYEEIGVKLWDTDEIYNESWNWKDKSLFIENYHKQWRKIERSEIRPFDGVLFRNMCGVATHVGIIVSRFRFMHAVKGVGVITTSIADINWEPKIEGFFRNLDCEKVFS